MSRLVEVAFPLPLDATFTYDVPAELSEISIGQRVLAPFQTRTLTGYVVNLPPTAGEFETKSIHAVLDESPILTPDLIELLRFMAKTYGVALGEALQTVVPPGLKRQSRRVIRATDQEGEPTTEEEAGWLAKIRKSRGLDWIATLRRDPSAEKTLLGLESDGWVKIETILRMERARGTARAKIRKPDAAFERASEVDLSPEQALAVGRIEQALSDGRPDRFLLHGITGSGKTEVYLRATALALERGCTVLALVPEIALTPQFVGRFRSRFGDRVAVLHSARSENERLHEWMRIRRGEATVVIGARSAVFAPLEKIGLIILDEEHDPSYKQNEGVLYHAKDLALFRAEGASAVVVSGSATPSLESYHAAEQGEASLLTLSRRMTGQQLPDVRIVDLRGEVSRFGEKGILSTALREAVTETLSRGEQSILFLNRRGFAPLVICPSCGTSLRCTDCSVTMTFHSEEGAHLCHYCGKSLPTESPCPECKAPKLLRLGVGTERVERELGFLFPDARIARFDRDAVQKRGSHERILRKLADREIDIVIGTQMITKGLDLPHVTLVGVLMADQSLHFPDFRAAERTFQLLTQVVGRSGRGERAGIAVVQTFQPEHYAVASGVNQNYAEFYAKELAFRRELAYPPFTSLALVEISGTDADEVRKAAQWLARQCQRSLKEKGAVSHLGPAPAPIRKIQGKTRYHLLLRSPRGSQAAAFGRWLAAETRKAFADRDLDVRLDIDPTQFL